MDVDLDMNKTATQVMEEQIANDMAKLIQEEIDWEIISDLFIKTGWTKVDLPTLGSNELAVDMNEWMHAECKHHWKRRGKTFIFENKNEAALFRLTWS